MSPPAPRTHALGFGCVVFLGGSLLRRPDPCGRRRVLVVGSAFAHAITSATRQRRPMPGTRTGCGRFSRGILYQVVLLIESSFHGSSVKMGCADEGAADPSRGTWNSVGADTEVTL